MATETLRGTVAQAEAGDRACGATPSGGFARTSWRCSA